MRRAVIVSGCVSILALMGAYLSWLGHAHAETQFTLGPPPTAAIAWTSPGAWDQPGYPNATTHSANLSRPLASSLTANLGPNAITLAGLTMGSTTSPINTNIAGTGELIFQNDDAGFNAGIPLITSAGVPGATNTISVPVRLNEQLDFSAASANDIRIQSTVFASGAAPSIRSFMPAGRVAKIDSLNLSDPNDPFNYRHFRLNDSAGSPPDMLGVSTQGTLEFGEVFGYGELRIGVTAGQQPVPLGTVILRGPNNSGGFVQLNRANVVLANDRALGDYAVFGGQPNQAVGMNLISDSDSRRINVEARLSQWFTIKGEHSLTWNGVAAQSNSRGWINLLPAGKTFTLNGGQYAMSGSDTERTFSYDGTGLTVVTGGLHDKYDFTQGPVSGGTGHFRKSGTGTLLVTHSTSTYHGNTIIEAGTLRFSQAEHLANSPAIISTGGALGVNSGIYSDASLLAKLDSADTGGIMLASSEATMNLDFTSGDLANAANTSVAAPEHGIMYTGTITPGGPNYRLGGGTGKLIIPLQNQLTGNRGLTATNGGEVELLAANNYSGPTIVSDYAFNSRTNQAIADVTSGISTALFAPTTLTIIRIANGGVDSSIGKSSSDAANLVLRGSTLRITALAQGSSQSTDRLFTIGARGATIETAGGARVNFTNPGALVVEPAGPGTRTLTLGTDQSVVPCQFQPLIPDAADGGIVGLTKIGTGTWILGGDNSYSGPTQVRSGELRINGNQTGTGESIVDVGATLGGRGAIGGDAEIAGALDVDSSFHIAGNLDFLPASEFLAGIRQIDDFTTVSVAGAVHLAGTFRFRQIPVFGRPYEPKLGDTFTILHAAGGISGAFDQIVLQNFSRTLRWETLIDDSSIRLRVAAVPEPNCLILFALAACLLPLRRR